MAEEIKIIATLDDKDLTDGLKKIKGGLKETGEEAKKLENYFKNANKNIGKSLFNLKEELLSLQSAVFTEKDRNKIALYNKEIKNVEKQMASLSAIGTSGFGALGNGARKAFGAIRNIAYLLPGIGIAGLLGFAVEPIAAFIGKLFEASDAVKKLQEEEKKREDFNKDVAKNFAKEVTQLQVLRAVIENSNVPLEKRLQAIKDLKKEYPGYFDNLNTDGLLNGQLAQYYDLATQAILRKARASAATAAIEDIANKKMVILLKDQIENTKRLKALSTAGAGIQNKNAIGGGAFISLAETKKAINDQYILKRNAGQKEIDALNEEQAFYLKIASDGAAEFNKIDAVKVKNASKTAKKIKELIYKEFSGAPPIDFILDIPFNPIIPSFSDPSFLKELQQVGIQFGKELGTVFENPQTLERTKGMAFVLGQNFTAGFTEGLKNLNDKDFLAEVDKLIAKLDAKKQVVTDIFVSFGQSVGEGLATGGKFLSKALSSILNLVGDYLVQMGKALILASALIQSIKIADPVAGFAAGLASVILGSVLKNIKLPAFATGVSNFSGGTALVGERGPELVTLPRGSSVTPSAQTNSLIGGGMVFIPEMVLRGQDIVISYNRASQANRRNGQ
jgi:hypothetical protein